MKIALLVTGELRDFASCAHTLPLINDPNVDLYISTWDESRSQNSVLNIDTTFAVTEQMIRDIVKRDAVIAIEPLSCMTEPRYNSKMLHRWIVGYDLVKDSGKTYDYVLFIRPDLYFDNNRISLTQEFQVAWYRPEAFLQDCVFGGPPAIIDVIFEKVTISAWQNATEGDWHKWWTAQIKELGITPTSFGREYRFTFFRPNARGAETYQQVYKAYEDWRDACIIEFGSKFGFRGPRDSWGDAIVDSALAKHQAGLLSASKTKRCLVFYGKVRNWDLAEFSKDALEPDDVKIISWDEDADEVARFASAIGASNSILASSARFNLLTRRGPNSFRILFLWEQFFSLVGSNDFDEYILIRPDSFVWVEDRDALNLAISEVQTLGVNQLPDVLDTLTDHFVVVKRGCGEMLCGILRKAIMSHETEIHRCLNRFIPDAQQAKYPSLSRSVDVLFVRDTFKRLQTDRYNYDLYRAVFYDSASWWRRTHALSYGGEIRQKGA